MPKARPVASPKALDVDENRPSGNKTDARCRYCGNEERETALRSRKARTLRERARTFQVVVACSSCGAAFAALSRN